MRLSLPPAHSDHTADVVLDALIGEGAPNAWWLTAIGAGASAIGMAIAFVLFRSEASLVLVFLTALGVMPIVDRLLIENRNAHELGVHGDRPDERLARGLLALFLGSFLLFGVVALLTEQVVVEALFHRQLVRYVAATSLSALEFGGLVEVLVNNGLVTVTVLLFALIYRAGGVALVLLWNASVWGSVLAWVARLSGRDASFAESLYNFTAGLLAIGPHLLFEALGYVLAAMAGVSIMRGLVKGGPIAGVKRPLKQMAIAVVLLIIGALTEAAVPELVIRVLV
jgi:hypothetical protein